MNFGRVSFYTIKLISNTTHTYTRTHTQTYIHIMQFTTNLLLSSLLLATLFLSDFVNGSKTIDILKEM